MGKACRMYEEKVWGEVYIEFWCGNIGDREHLDDPEVDGKIILRWNIRNKNGVCTGLIWFRRGTGGEHL